MTLLIAGYDYEKTMDFSEYSDNPKKNQPTMDVCGLFAIADSAITTQQGGKTLLNGFRKVYELEAILWKPYFMPDGSFRDYREIYERRPFFLGFSGSTLTAQHIINGITEHLGKLRISYSRVTGGSIKYEVIRHCKLNPLNSSSEAAYWDDDTFLDSDFEGLLTAETISSFIEYSINKALLSASKYKLSMDEFNAMHTDLVSGAWCPYKKRYELYIYRMLSKRDDDGVLQPCTEKRLLPPSELAVLGMKNRFEDRAQESFNTAISEIIKPSTIILEFLENAIDEVKNNGSKEIDRPISFRKLDSSGITRIQ